jgi:hypothetical protein
MFYLLELPDLLHIGGKNTNFYVRQFMMILEVILYLVLQLGTLYSL